MSGTRLLHIRPCRAILSAVGRRRRSRDSRARPDATGTSLRPRCCNIRACIPAEFPVGDRCLADDPDPLVLGLPAGLHGYGSARQRFFDDIGDVTALRLEHRGRVRRYAGLGEAGEELVGETVAHHAVKRQVAIGPVIVERQGIAARDRVDAESTSETQS
jgi:hypothetical protein